jgi:sulfite oxidase
MEGKRRDMQVHEPDPCNAAPPGAVLAAGVLTPIDAFSSRNHGPVPRIDRRPGDCTWTASSSGR